MNLLEMLKLFEPELEAKGYKIDWDNANRMYNAVYAAGLPEKVVEEIVIEKMKETLDNKPGHEPKGSFGI